MLGKTNAVSGKQKYGAYNIEEVEVDGGVVLEITDADEKPVDKIQLRCDIIQSLQYAFAGSEWQGPSAVDLIYEMLDGVDTSNVTNMRGMFYNASYLIPTQEAPLYLKNINTSKVTDMSEMFHGCFNLRYIDISNFDTSKVTNMSSMFYQLKIVNMDLTNFNTSKVKNMYHMFAHCEELTTLDLSSFDTSSVTNIQSMFYECRELSVIQGALDLYSVTYNSNMFYNTFALTGVTLKNIRISLQIGSGTSYGHLWELAYLVNAIKELWDFSSGTQKTLTIGSANLEKIANVYVKLVDVTDEMIAADEYASNKLPCVECESTDEGAMTLTAYAGLKNWVLA